VLAMSGSRFDVSKIHPPLIERLLESKRLTIVNVYRDGPRYWVGQVSTRDGENLILKAVVDDTGWTEPDTEVTHQPSDQLKAEISISAALEQHSQHIAGNVPCIKDSSSEGDIWILRELQKGRDMSIGKSPLIFRPDFFTDVSIESLVDYIVSYQRLSPLLVPLLPHPATVVEVMRPVDLDNPTELLAPYAPAINAYMDEYSEIYARHCETLTHGQVFPPHIYQYADTVGFIDWENANLRNHLQDFVSVWIRSYRHPVWRDKYLELLIKRGLLIRPEDRVLWRMEVLLQSAGNLNYLFWSKNEEPRDQATLILGFRRQIEEVLAKTV
jgi:hypothetical protein